MSKEVTTLENLIAKIDNDFNPDNSDWIPRVGAWAIEAMMQLRVLRTVEKKRKLNVVDGYAKSPCDFDKNNIKVYDKNNCEIPEASSNSSNCCSSSDSLPTGGDSECHVNPRGTLEHGYDENRKDITSVSFHVNTIDERARYNVQNIELGNTARKGRNYVLASPNIIELNFDTDYIYVVSNEVETCFSNTYGCDLPVIPNNGILLEAITYYCMYKMLTRGYKHPVMNLAASQYGTNPYYLWTTLKEKAKASVTLDSQRNDGKDSAAWQSYFYNATFPTK